MATKSEEFRSLAERSHSTTKPPKAKKVVKKSPEKKRASAAAPTSPNESKHAARKASYALEVSAKARPSRKSTRKSANHQKTDSQLQLRQTRRATGRPG